MPYFAIEQAVLPANHFSFRSRGGDSIKIWRLSDFSRNGTTNFDTMKVPRALI